MTPRERNAHAIAEVLKHLGVAVSAARGVGLEVDALQRMLKTEWMVQARRDPTPIELARAKRRRREAPR
jgi:ribosomal protein L13E